MSTPVAELLAHLSLSLNNAWQDEPCRDLARKLSTIEFLKGTRAGPWLANAILHKRETVVDLSGWSAEDAGQMLLLITAYMTTGGLSLPGLQLQGALILVFLPLAAGHLGAVSERLYSHLASMGGSN